MKIAKILSTFILFASVTAAFIFGQSEGIPLRVDRIGERVLIICPEISQTADKIIALTSQKGLVVHAQVIELLWKHLEEKGNKEGMPETNRTGLE